MTKDRQIVGHGTMSYYRDNLNISFTDGENVYKIIPYSLNGQYGLNFNVERATTPDPELKKALKDTLRSLISANPVMVFNYHKGNYYASKNNRDYIAFKLFNKLVILKHSEYKKILNDSLAKEIGKIKKGIRRLKIKLQSI